jgi:hypothetical protein
MRESSSDELCPQCTCQAERVYTPPQISPSAKAFEPHFNYGLGKEVLRKNDIKEELARIKGETGKEIVEVGSDSLGSVKQQKQKYTINQGEIDAIKAQVRG